MFDHAVTLFGAEGFMPHGHCFQWTPSLLSLYLMGDGVIAASYYSIPAALVYFVRKRADLQFNWIFLMFSAFIFACGTTHLIGIWTIWHPDYWLDASVKFATAAVSAVTAILLWPLIPRALRLPSAQQLRAAIASLEAEVAERRRAEEEAHRARQAAEAASRAKTEFLSRMSHELRTPLNAVLGFSQLMEMDAKLTPDDQERVRHIQTAGWHLLNMINEVLDLSRIESGQMMVTRESVDIVPIVAESVRMAEPLAAEHGVQLQDETAGLSALHALGDHTRLRQVFTNLLSNAIKYNRRGGLVTVSARIADGGDVEIAVADTGRGFTPAQLQRLYKPFDRLGAETETISGTGIGLVITKRLVELMGGSLGLTTEAGGGSTFTLRLHAAPAVDAAAAPSATASVAAGDGARYTVLYVEDNPSNVALLANMLAMRQDMRLVTAPDGMSGLAAARSHHPDLIVIDIALPGINGYDVCAALRSDPAFASTPIIALSANAMPGDVARGEEAGFDAYLTKPVKVEQFLAKLDRLLHARVH
jgi:signal transduction histidine kinase/CheY-like chemotaxis protein